MFISSVCASVLVSVGSTRIESQPELKPVPVAPGIAMYMADTQESFRGHLFDSEFNQGTWVTTFRGDYIRQSLKMMVIPVKVTQSALDSSRVTIVNPQQLVLLSNANKQLYTVDLLEKSDNEWSLTYTEVISNSIKAHATITGEWALEDTEQHMGLASAAGVLAEFSGLITNSCSPTFEECRTSATNTCSPRSVKSITYSCNNGAVTCSFECNTTSN
jgi:hypothetical protein